MTSPIPAPPADVDQLRALVAKFEHWLAKHSPENNCTAQVLAAAMLCARELPGLLDELVQTRAKAERYRVELRDKGNDLLNVRGLLSPNGYPRRVPMEIGEVVAPAVEWLLNQLTEAQRQRDEAIGLLHTIHYGVVNAPARELWMRLIVNAAPVPAPASGHWLAPTADGKDLCGECGQPWPCASVVPAAPAVFCPTSGKLDAVGCCDRPHLHQQMGAEASSDTAPTCPECGHTPHVGWSCSYTHRSGTMQVNSHCGCYVRAGTGTGQQPETTNDIAVTAQCSVGAWKDGQGIHSADWWHGAACTHCGQTAAVPPTADQPTVLGEGPCPHSFCVATTAHQHVAVPADDEDVAR